MTSKEQDLNFSGTVYSREWSLGVESWSGVIFWLVNEPSLVCLYWQQNHTRTLTWSISSDFSNGLLQFMMKRARTLATPPFYSTPLQYSAPRFHSKVALTGLIINITILASISQSYHSLSFDFATCPVIFYDEQGKNISKFDATPRLHSKTLLHDSTP